MNIDDQEYEPEPDPTDEIALTALSSETAHVPSMVEFAQHLYAHGVAAEQAMGIMRELFDYSVEDEALIEILRGARSPLFSEEDFERNAQTYLFLRSEIKEAAYKNLGL